MKLYVVTANGELGGYGSEIYLVGVFTSQEAAENAMVNNALQYNITEVIQDKVYPLVKESDTYYDNANYLGGYVE